MLILRSVAPAVILGVVVHVGGDSAEHSATIEKPPGAEDSRTAPLAAQPDDVVPHESLIDRRVPNMDESTIFCRPAVLVPVDLYGTREERIDWCRANGSPVATGDAIVICPANPFSRNELIFPDQHVHPEAPEMQSTIRTPGSDPNPAP